MGEREKSLVETSYALARFDPKARKELVVRGLNALTEIKDADFYFLKGEEFRMQGELKRAIECYERSLEINHEHEDSLFWMGYCYMPVVVEHRRDDLELDNNIRNERAASAFQKLIDLRKRKDSTGWSSFVVYYNLGVSQFALGLYRDSIESAKRAIELNRENHKSYYLLGLSQEEVGIFHLAMENFETYLSFEDLDLLEEKRFITYAKERVVQLKNQLTDSYFFSIGLDFWEKGQYQEAIECCEKAIEINPNYAQVYYNLALGQEALGIYHLALENFETYLSLDAYQRPKKLECVEYAKRRVQEIKQLLTDSYFFSIGLDFWEKGEYPKAIECYERTIKLNPSFADAYFNLALAQEKIAKNHSFQSVLPLFAEANERKDIHKLVLDNFEKYLHLEDHELPDHQQYITYAKKRVEELRETLSKGKKK